jgi:hypothetical protein
VNLIVHPVADQRRRITSFRGYTLTGWEYEEGWLMGVSLRGRETVTTLWVDGSFESPGFHSLHAVQFDDSRVLEIDGEPIELTQEERDVVLGTIWEWEIWEPITKAGTCMIDSLERMLDLPRDRLVDWFRIAGRNPSIQEDVVKTLEEKSYTVDVAGPNGFGQFHEYRRLVVMFQKKDPKNGHVVLIYENNSGIFDASGVFKKVSDILFTGTLGYDRGPVICVRRDG